MTEPSKISQVLLGKPRDVKDPNVFHRVSLVAFLAWVGLGADGLSSSAYGPDEAFRALGTHRSLAIFLVAMTAFTIFVISIAYANLIEHFPGGGGGYLVATKLLGPKVGVVSGCALLVDYVLTITTSVASGCDQIWNFLSARDAALQAPRRDRGPRRPGRPEPPGRQGVGDDPRADLHRLHRHARVRDPVLIRHPPHGPAGRRSPEPRAISTLRRRRSASGRWPSSC